jgi:hypothetical protein
LIQENLSIKKKSINYIIALHFKIKCKIRPENILTYLEAYGVKMSAIGKTVGL